MKQGYLFLAVNNSNNTVTLLPYVANGASLSPQPTYTSSFTVAANAPTWYRATATGNVLKFECSGDSINWEGGGTATFVDNTYSGGTTQLLWGFGAADFSWSIDNITYYAPKLSTSKLALQGFDYAEGAGPSASQVFTVSGQSLKTDVPVQWMHLSFAMYPLPKDLKTGCDVSSYEKPHCNKRGRLQYTPVVEQHLLLLRLH